ncbi:Brp/Blh family beta-carotene 15,15'-dioxygenase [Yeosuana marina]|uniref:Brp/Blh family beta-carotene 15,15'-dioxygenase n=1 Tax=Yeosuana marina TaxID=1565536 RepID=UPI00141E5A02|nr:Brp/Blh family beta-carotene 15,15'-dioxygenase [Yeosuana marina]
MEKIYNLSIVLSFLGLWLNSSIPKNYEIALGFILIFSFGILHGSNDILLIENISNKKTHYPILKIVVIYVISVFTAVCIFYFMPLIALILFIFSSAFHFGEQHWEHKISNNLKSFNKLYYFFYGLFVLMLLFVFNSQEVIDVIKSIANYTLTKDFIVYSFIITAAILILLSINLIYKSETFKSIYLKELFYLLVFSVVFKVSTLIWGFTMYFIFWHSIPSLFEQITFIYGSFKKEHVIRYTKKAFPYWLISLLGLAIVVFIFKNQQSLYAILFSFIAALTFPHSIVINKMFLHKNNF